MGGSYPWVHADSGQTRPCCPGTGSCQGSFLPPPLNDPLPGGQVKGTLRVSLRDRCATPDMPVRSQDRQLSGSGRKTAQTLPAPGARLRGLTGTARQSVQAMILHVPRNFLNSETAPAEAGKAQVQGL
jgi:hypothetical protein